MITVGAAYSDTQISAFPHAFVIFFRYIMNFKLKNLEVLAETKIKLELVMN